MRYSLVVLLALALFSSCGKYNPKRQIDTRNFKMGFSTWSYGPNSSDRENTYNFINANGDIRSVQMDDKIPWNAWINNTALPNDYVDDLNFRVSKLNAAQELLLSISPLNTERTNIIEDWNTGTQPSVTSFSDPELIEAFVMHAKYLIDAFEPNYVVYSMESNDLLLNAPEKWSDYRIFMETVKDSLQANYPNIELAESVTLHNWYKSDVTVSQAHFQTIKTLISQQDFAAISFYPFFSGMKKHKEYQEAFDFLHANVSIPIAFSETAQLAEDLEVSAFGLEIESNEKIQNDYLQSLLVNAHDHNYKFVIWWAYRDYDALWETFPNNIQDIGKLWRDTGLLEGNGRGRCAMKTWQQIYEK